MPIEPDEAEAEAEGSDDPSLGIFDGSRPLMPESEFYDKWGNLKIPPIKIIEENHGENSIKIFIYQYQAEGENSPVNYYFGFQLKIEKLIRQKRANIADSPMRGIDDSRASAQNLILEMCKKNKIAKRTFAEFSIIRYNQPELF